MFPEILFTCVYLVCRHSIMASPFSLSTDHHVNFDTHDNRGQFYLDMSEHWLDGFASKDTNRVVPSTPQSSSDVLTVEESEGLPKEVEDWDTDPLTHVLATEEEAPMDESTTEANSPMASWSINVDDWISSLSRTPTSSSSPSHKHSRDATPESETSERINQHPRITPTAFSSLNAKQAIDSSIALTKKTSSIKNRPMNSLRMGVAKELWDAVVFKKGGIHFNEMIPKNPNPNTIKCYYESDPSADALVIPPMKYHGTIPLQRLVYEKNILFETITFIMETPRPTCLPKLIYHQKKNRGTRYSNLIRTGFRDDLTKHASIAMIDWIQKPNQDNGHDFVIHYEINRLTQFPPQNLCKRPLDSFKLTFPNAQRYAKPADSTYIGMETPEACLYRVRKVVIMRTYQKNKFQEVEACPPPETVQLVY